MRSRKWPLGRRRWLFVFSILLAPLSIHATIHNIVLRDDSRRNIILTDFGYNAEGTLDMQLVNFTVPVEVLNNWSKDGETKGPIGFTLSRGSNILDGVSTAPSICQLLQEDQDPEAVFFKFDPESNPPALVVKQTGGLKLTLCPSYEKCMGASTEPTITKTATTTAKPQEKPADEAEKREKRFDFLGLFKRNPNGSLYVDYIPLQKDKDSPSYSANISIRFSTHQVGKYHLIYHNCYNYKQHGYSDRIAVDMTVILTERNIDSYLSAGDIPKPQLYLYISLMFVFAGALWTHKLCMSQAANVYRVHGLMTCLVFLKALTCFFHGVNYYFVSKYGHQREIWAVVYYITHLLKGALLFGTILLIGTGYTFFKNFLTERDRRLFMIVLPLQVIDNIAMVIFEESEFGNQNYQFWSQIFIFLDLVCCVFILLPIIWSMRHLHEGARSDGKAAFNLEKLALFRQFYAIVIAFIYLTRISKYAVQSLVPFNYEWMTDAVVELSTLFFYVLVGQKFRPVARNPYLRLQQDEDCDIALTQNGIFENVTNRSRGDESRILMEDIPGTEGGYTSDSDPEDDKSSALSEYHKHRRSNSDRTSLM